MSLGTGQRRTHTLGTRHEADSRAHRAKDCPVVSLTLSNRKFKSWKSFLDNAYWSVELV
jgi:hypothetical protein